MTKTELTDIHPCLELKVSSRAKRMRLRLDSKNRVINLVMPKRASLKKAREFALDHEEWIKDKLAALPAPVPFTQGSIIPVLGQDRHVHIDCDTTLKSTRIELKNNEISISTNKKDPAGRITRFLKKESRDTLTGLAHEKAAQIGKTIESVQIRDTKSRWGSCGPDGRISFSWRLIFAPWGAMDYVVAHEVAHLIHMNHGPKFWALCTELSEDYSTGKKWMRQNGHSLMKYGT